MPMTPEELALTQYLLGPWLIGCFIDVFLQGILFSQFVRYLSYHEGDKQSLKITVLVLAILTTLKSIQSFALIWIQLILNFMDLEGAILLNYTAWWQTGNPLMVATIGLYVQAYFCNRLYIISGKKWWIVAPVALVLAFAFASICTATYYISEGAAAGAKIALWFAAHLSSVFAGDITMTLLMAFFLLRTKREVLPQTVGLITALIRLTFMTAAPAALCAMFNLIFSQIWSGDDRLVSTAFNQALPKLYAMSMMWTLNSRRNIREANARGSYSNEHSSGHGRGVNRAGRGGRFSTGNVKNALSGMGRGTSNGNVELGNISIQTRMETTQHFDPRDMFHRKADIHTSLGADDSDVGSDFKDQKVPL